MPGLDLLLSNLLSPIVLAFALGIIAGFIKSELELPEPVLKLLAIYLLFSIGIKGGTELAAVSLGEVAPLLAAAAALTIGIPVAVFFTLRKIGRFDAANAAAVAAHYGSVSSVTFFASLSFAKAMNTPAEGYMTAVVAIMEWGVIIALLLGRWALGKEAGNSSMKSLALETLRGRGILLLTGGMVIGMLAGEKGWQQIAPFYDDIFRGMLMLFLLEMGMTAARQMHEFRKVGVFMTGFAIVTPILLGLVGTWIGHAAGLSVGGAFVLGAVCASASYIDAPAACRASLPQANPGIYLTASLGVTFPFNLLFGLPLYYQFALWLAR
ncbi:MAG: sodium-dependent bicarbonate transport family permease [Betaproteobacteria bacterium]|nr:sodium-dependent bicarbonate transport family permease [Betaproteobacteria bacterium]